MKRSLRNGPIEGFFGALITNFLPPGVAGLFAYLNGVNLWWVAGILLSTLVIVILANVLLTLQPLLRYKDTQLSNFLTEYLEMVEDEVQRMTDEEVNVRANVMRVQPSLLYTLTRGKAGKRTIELSYVGDRDDYDEEEFELSFDVGQGCCGRVIQDNKAKVAESTPEESQWGVGWGTNRRQDRVTSDLCTIIGVPIYKPEDNDQSNPVGVLVVDSKDEPKDMFNEPAGTRWGTYDFGDTGIVKRTAEHAKNIGILI